jgi:hypothetical protein
MPYLAYRKAHFRSFKGYTVTGIAYAALLLAVPRAAGQWRFELW